MNPADQRVQRTRKQLKESFITLVNERGFDDVTIRDVTNHAGVGYRTFFRHYKDTKELLEDALLEFAAEVKQVLLPPDSLEMTERNVITMFEFIEKNVDLFRALYRSPNFEDYLTPLAEFGRKVGRVVFVPSYIPQPILEAHFLGSMMSLQRWWVEQGMPIPAQEMGRYAHDLIVRPIMQLEGIYPISAD
ncbi:MAG: TetR/AcrR family transcriptional regulator [Chloroflexota bacterium]